MQLHKLCSLQLPFLHFHFISFVAFSFSLMLLFQGHVAGENFTLTGPYQLQPVM